MNIVVCVKTASGGAVSAEDAFQRGGRVSAGLLAPHDAHAVEAALRLAEAAGGEVIVVAVAPAEALGAVREALALGASRGVILSDPALAGADVMATGRALAELLAAQAFDLAMTCSWSGDVDGTLLWAAAARHLDLPVLTQAGALTVEAGEATTRRQTETGDVTCAAALPCLVEVTETINKPRYPTMKGKLAAKGKPIKVIDLAALGLAADDVAPGTAILGLGVPAGRPPAARLEDPALAPAGIVRFLAERRLI